MCAGDDIIRANRGLDPPDTFNSDTVAGAMDNGLNNLTCIQPIGWRLLFKRTWFML